MLRRGIRPANSRMSFFIIGYTNSNLQLGIASYTVLEKLHSRCLLKRRTHLGFAYPTSRDVKRTSHRVCNIALSTFSKSKTNNDNQASLLPGLARGGTQIRCARQHSINALEAIIKLAAQQVSFITHPSLPCQGLLTSFPNRRHSSHLTSS